jgi:DNA-binding beta-propeller fold protein YncE
MRFLMIFLLFISSSASAGLLRVHRIEGFTSKTSAAEQYDADLRSPKSVRFSASGTKLYINALEAGKTLVYDFPSLRKEASISHSFNATDVALFPGRPTIFGYPYFQSAPPNIFVGKPVESEFSHNGKYLWVPYYRRSFDPEAKSPSAVAVIDTQTNKIVRVLPTGPLPKYVAVSPDGTKMVVTSWGDNTLAVYDISSQDPAGFHAVMHLSVGRPLAMANISGDRDHNCGYCLRGTVFLDGGKLLLVARMGGGGIAGFNMESGAYLGTLYAVPATPRHLALSPDGDYLYVSSCASGMISRVLVTDLISSFGGAKGGTVAPVKLQSRFIGFGARTIAPSLDGRFIYAAVNGKSELVQLDAKTLAVLSRSPVDPYAVGLAVSPDGNFVVTSSQGHAGRGGGNAVDIYRVLPGSD